MIRKKNIYLMINDFKERINEVIGDLMTHSRGEEGFTPYSPPTDLSEDESNYYIEMELPGVSIEDVEIFCDDHYLTVKGERKLPKDVLPTSVQRMERYFGNFSRTFEFPVELDKERVEAKLQNGILLLCLPKKSERIKIEIK